MSSNRTNTTSAAAALNLIAAIGVTAVVYVEHRHAIRTSALLSLYLFIGFLVEIAKSRSYFTRGLTASAAIAVAAAAARLALIGLEELSKRDILIDPDIRKISDGEATSGFFTRTLFLFLGPMLRIGFKRALMTEDLANLGIDFASKHLFLELAAAWKESEEEKMSLFFACCRAWNSSILAILAPRFCDTGFRFAQPFLMQQIIEAVAPGANVSTQKKQGLIVATGFTFFGAAVCRAATRHMKTRLTARLRGGLFSHLLDKTHKLEIQQGRKQGAITLMSADFDGIATGLPAFIEMPFTILESGIGMYFLSRLVGLSCLSIFAPLSISTLLGLLFGKYSTPALKFWNENIETRVAKTSRVLAQLPAIKALGLGPSIAQYIQHLRVVETQSSRKYRVIQAISTGFAVIVDVVTPVIVIAAALFSSVFGDRISAQLMYPTLGIVALLQGPLADLLKAYPTTMAMLSCFERIEAYLRLDDHEDPRVVLSVSTEEASEMGNSPDLAVEAPQETEKKNAGDVLRFDNATIAPRGSDKPVLKSLNFAIAAGSMNGVFGLTGSGKSTFLESILGETEILDGALYIDDVTIAVCGQQVWLPNTSFRDAIVGNCAYDPVWFNFVVDHCGLREDLEALSGGEDHIIGSNGVALSGGQRQRIGIARAVYCRPKVILFDDIFSSIDKSTAVDILMALCGTDGLLRSWNCTVIMATYLPESVDLMQNLVLIDDHGIISYEPRLLPNGRPTINALYLRVSLLPDQDKHTRKEMPVQRPLVVRSERSQTPGHLQSNDAIQDRRKGDLGLYKLWFDAIGRRLSSIWAFLVVLMGTNEIFSLIYVRIWIAVAPENQRFIIGYALIALLAGFLSSVCIFLNHVQLSPRASIGLHQQLTTTVMQSTLGFLGTTDYGSILNRYSQDMEQITKHIPQAIYATIYCGTTSLVQTGVIMSTATYLTASLPFLLGAIIGIQHCYLRSSRQLRLLEIETQAPLVKELRETSTGLIYIRAFDYKVHGFNRSLRLLDESQKPFYYLLCSQAFLSLTLDIVSGVIALVLAIITLFVRSPSQNATGLAFLTLVNLGTSFNRFVTYWASSETSVGSLSRLRDFVRSTPREARPDKAVELPPNWPTNGVIQVRNISARYRVNKDEADEYILRDLSINFEPGKKTGVVGRSGCGKSSLLYTLLGFLEYKGSILIDGVDIKTAHPDQLRSRIITISQDMVELEGTVRDNLLPYHMSWPPPTGARTKSDKAKADQRDAVARETLVRFGLWHGLVEHGGLNAKLDKLGFSQGEKQLLCIARAVVRRQLTGSRVLLVDEATAHVDNGRDKLVRDIIKEFFTGCTIIVVAHRIETVVDSNYVAHMADGCIQEVENCG